MSNSEEEYDYQREIEPDEHTLKENLDRSRYVFAMISFLIALIFLGIFFNNYYDILSGWFLLFGAFVFGATGIFFVWSNSHLDNHFSTKDDLQNHEMKNSFLAIETTEHEEVDDSLQVDGFSPFEELVKEALATIPAEFHEKMENVLVRVQYEPGNEVMHRVGVKEGYTLLGLYEGVPLTAYGQARMPHPEIITIYERSIVEYCHGDPERIRRQVRHTVLHEVAHHFGIDHEEMPIWIR